MGVVVPPLPPPAPRSGAKGEFGKPQRAYSVAPSASVLGERRQDYLLPLAIHSWAGNRMYLDNKRATYRRGTRLVSKPPIPLDEIRESILAAIRDFDWEKGRPILAELVGNTPAYMAKHFALEHTIPSPSSVTSCRRQLWYKTHDTEVDRTLPESWAMRAVNGMVMEPWWFMILGLADPRLVVTTIEEPLDIAPGIAGSPDGYLSRLPALLELKSQTGWKFSYNIKGGIHKESPEHVAQCQLYMHGAGLEWTLYLAASADPQLLKWVKKFFAKKDEKADFDDYPFFLLEWVEYNPKEATRLIERMGVIREDLESEELAPREYDPETTRWPCQLGCRWKDQCVEAG